MIVVDIGNTKLQFAWIKDKKILKTANLATDAVSKKKIIKILAKYPKEGVLVCSVVPRVTKLFQNLNNKVFVVGRDIRVPIKSLYSKKEIGMDRLVGAFSARLFFPKVRFILDFGTAITLDFLSKNGTYQGGIILPGIGSTLRALSGCALLPKKIKFKRIRKTIPTGTKESINKGLEEGFSLMINSLIKKYKCDLKVKPREKVLITGGEALISAPKLDFPYKYEPFLVLKGLAVLAGNLIHKPSR